MPSLNRPAQPWWDRIPGHGSIDWTQFDNLRAAVEWALGADPLRAMQLIGALKDFLGRRSHSREGLRWVEEALALTGDKVGRGEDGDLTRFRALADVWLALCTLSVQVADNATALAAATESVALWRSLGELNPLIHALLMQSLAASFRGEPALALAAAEEGVHLGRALPESEALGSALTMRARMAAELENDLVAARRYIDEARVHARAARDNWTMAMNFMGLGATEARAGDFERARSHLSESMAGFEAEGDEYFVNVLRSELANAERLAGNYDDAVSLFSVALPEWWRLGNRGGVSRILECLGFAARACAAQDGSESEQHRLLERMARLCGAAEALREEARAGMTPMEQREYAAELEAARSALPEATWQAAWNAGRAMSADDAIAYALQP